MNLHYEHAPYTMYILHYKYILQSTIYMYIEEIDDSIIWAHGEMTLQKISQMIKKCNKNKNKQIEPKYTIMVSPCSVSESVQIQLQIHSQIRQKYTMYCPHISTTLSDLSTQWGDASQGRRKL